MDSTFTIDHRDWHYDVSGGRLQALSGDMVQMQIMLAPTIEGRQTEVTEWGAEERGLFRARLSEGGSVCLQVREGHLAYWMDTHLTQIETLTYFPETSFTGSCWHTFMSDAHDCTWDVDQDQEVGVSTAYDGFSPFGADGQGMTDPGDFPPYWIWNTPVRAFAVHTGAGWLGFSMPGPLPVGLVRLGMKRSKLSISFDVVRGSCPEGMMPRVYFVTGLDDRDDILDQHRLVSCRLGFVDKKASDHPSWWTFPEYNYWDEYVRTQKASREQGKREPVLTAERYQEWLNTAKETLGLEHLNCTLEQGCYNYYGDYRPTEYMGEVEGLRAMVDRLREQGTHVGHYIHPYIVNDKCDFWSEHPEAFLKPKDKAHKSWWALEENVEKPDFHFLDWTHPLSREFMQAKLEFLYSDAQRCLNCDIVRSNNWVSPDPRAYTFHDPDWGIGDLMSYKVQKFIYETAKKIKPQCMVSKLSVGDPYMQRWADANYLCEEWNGYTDNWYKRGRIATHTTEGMIFLTDAFIVTLSKGDEYHMGMLSWNYPQTTWVRHAVHPYMHYREVQQKHFRRRNAGFHAAAIAPVRRGDISRVSVHRDGEVEQWRKRSEGKLAGFYAGLAIGKRTLVTYSESEARIATSVDRSIEFPLPPAARVEAVEMVPHEGESQSWEYALDKTDDGLKVRMHVEDCGRRALYYRLRYCLR